MVKLNCTGRHSCRLQCDGIRRCRLYSARSTVAWVQRPILPKPFARPTIGYLGTFNHNEACVSRAGQTHALANDYEDGAAVVGDGVTRIAPAVPGVSTPVCRASRIFIHSSAASSPTLKGAKRRLTACVVIGCSALLFRGKTQHQLEAHTAQHVARAVADRDRVVRTVVE
jgi:hypothetical protein